VINIPRLDRISKRTAPSPVPVVPEEFIQNEIVPVVELYKSEPAPVSLPLAPTVIWSFSAALNCNQSAAQHR